jgi:hypothetical protein
MVTKPRCDHAPSDCSVSSACIVVFLPVRVGTMSVAVNDFTIFAAMALAGRDWWIAI